METITGKSWVFGDDVNTDVIHPPSFFSLDPETVKRGLFHGYDPDMQAALRPGDILVAGANFGCGSSRETSIWSMKLNHVGAVMAVSFARIFFRNATNNGLPCLTFREASDKQCIHPGEALQLDLDRAELITEQGEIVPLTPPGSFVRRIWQAGGLLAMLDQPLTPGT